MRFWKYHGLGNDYLVVDADELTSAEIRAICDRNRGVGSDGILLPTASAVADGDFGLRIFNPDGSEAEKSGNGLRIFARYLFDQQQVAAEQPFTIATLGGTVSARVSTPQHITVSMGQARLLARDHVLTVDNRTLTAQLVDMGNPHCVLFEADVLAELAQTLGPQLETHPDFPNRTNVQFAQVVDRQTLRLEVWERGAGYTLASGSSACAAVAATHWLGLVDGSERVQVRMPGGVLAVSIDATDQVTQQGPVVRVMEGVISAEIRPPA